jgi:S-adenosylmethionine:tRNA ribosyltransferase-isomerase
MKRLEIKGVNFAEITLHAGLGNFRDIEVEDLTKHKMDSEEMILEESQAKIINRTKVAKKKICAIGTTSMKAIETAVSITGMVKPYKGWTNKFIFPPYDFSVADAMITNLHLPMSSAMMMVAAFADYDFLMKAYKEAIAEKYNFFTYGDAMLIL